MIEKNIEVEIYFSKGEAYTIDNLIIQYDEASAKSDIIKTVLYELSNAVFGLWAQYYCGHGMIPVSDMYINEVLDSGDVVPMVSLGDIDMDFSKAFGDKFLRCVRYNTLIDANTDKERADKTIGYSIFNVFKMNICDFIAQAKEFRYTNDITVDKMFIYSVKEITGFPQIIIDFIKDGNTITLIFGNVNKDAIKIRDELAEFLSTINYDFYNKEIEKNVSKEY